MPATPLKSRAPSRRADDLLPPHERVFGRLITCEKLDHARITHARTHAGLQTRASATARRRRQSSSRKSTEFQATPLPFCLMKGFLVDYHALRCLLFCWSFFSPAMQWQRCYLGRRLRRPRKGRPLGILHKTCAPRGAQKGCRFG